MPAMGTTAATVRSFASAMGRWRRVCRPTTTARCRGVLRSRMRRVRPRCRRTCSAVTAHRWAGMALWFCRTTLHAIRMPGKRTSRCRPAAAVVAAAAVAFVAVARAARGVLWRESE